MRPVTLKRWSAIHSWTSLVSTAFLLLLCVTGLPLIFSDEIASVLEKPTAASPIAGGAADLDGIIAAARQRYPGDVVQFISWDDDAPLLNVVMAPALNAPLAQRHLLAFDLQAGTLLREKRSENKIMAAMLALHSELFAGLTGMIVVGVMGLLFAAAIVSGVVLYAPFMRRLAFGEIRRTRAARTKWLDLHNLFGIGVMAWMLMVGLTGALNSLTDPLFDGWRARAVSELLSPYIGKPPLGQLGSLQAAVAAVSTALPDMKPTGVIFPDTPFGAPGHYMIWTQGKTPLLSRLLTPALVDSESGMVTAIADLPWYLKALELSRPLHFGDYGGLPLKIVWALLDIAAIVVLGSGIYLWLSRRKSPLDARLAEIESGAA